MRFEAMASQLERSDILFEFLAIMRSAPILPLPLRPMQLLLIRAATNLMPERSSMSANDPEIPHSLSHVRSSEANYLVVERRLPSFSRCWALQLRSQRRRCVS